MCYNSINMNNFLYFYQHIPEHIDPIAFRIGWLSFRWYSISYLAAFLVSYFLLSWRIKQQEIIEEKIYCYPRFDKKKIINNQSGKNKAGDYFQRMNNLLLDFFLYFFCGLVIGGRLGEVFFYNFAYYSSHLWEIISPYDDHGNFIGLFGMSYFGGLIGIMLASFIFIRRNKINLLAWADFIVPAVPAGYFFGRIGNFLNGELYGKITDKFWGMIFSGSYQLRHPSQLYEAFLEGVVLFIIIWKVRNNKKFQGKMLSLYLIGYAAVRFISEFFREPDVNFGWVTLGQIFCLILFLCGLLIWRTDKKSV